MFSSCPSSRPLLCVASGQIATGCVSYTVRQGGSAEPGQDTNAGALTVSATALGSKSSHPTCFVLPITSSTVPQCFKKTRRKRRVGLENNICWILNIWMKLTKKIMNTQSGWGNIRVEVILLRS